MSLHHLALRVADPDLSARFYGGVLGLRELSRHLDADGSPRAVWLALGGAAVLMLERSLLPPGPTSGSAHVLVLAVDELSVVAARLAAAGVAIVERTAFTVYLHDPDGHRVGLSTFRFVGL
jgi:catechol 2,3-dioxygenase-like lactoylglutathione lyase family enzyme